MELARGALYSQIARSQIPPLSPADASEALSEAIEAGLRAALDYDEEKDRGRRTVPLEIRFRQFAMIRMRLRLIDWLRKEKGYSRNGTNGRTFPAAEVYPTDEEDPLDFEEGLVSRARLRKWTVAADALGLDVRELAVSLLDEASESVGG